MRASQRSQIPPGSGRQRRASQPSPPLQAAPPFQQARLSYARLPQKVARRFWCVCEPQGVWLTDAPWALGEEVGDAADAFAQVVVTEGEGQPGVSRCAEGLPRHDRDL